MPHQMNEVNPFFTGAHQESGTLVVLSLQRVAFKSLENVETFEQMFFKTLIIFMLTTLNIHTKKNLYVERLSEQLRKSQSLAKEGKIQDFMHESRTAHASGDDDAPRFLVQKWLKKVAHFDAASTQCYKR